MWASSWFQYVWRRVVFLSLASNVLLLLIFFSPVNAWIHALLQTGSPPVKGDAVVVMTSSFPLDTENGMLDHSTLARLEKGLRIYREGLAPKIICFGALRLPRSGKTVSEAMRERLLLYGVPDGDIIIQDEVMGTNLYYDNLLAMMKRHRQFDWNRVMFVTSTDQSRRITKALRSEIANPIVVVSEPFEVQVDWARRLHQFRRAANELFFALPFFQFTGKFG